MRRALIAGLLAIAACSGDGTSPGTTLTADGKWSATIVTASTPGGSGTMVLTLTQSGTTVSGSGTFTDPTDPPPAVLAVTGSISGTTVTLTLQVQPQQFNGQTIDQNKAPSQFTGTLTASTMNGSTSGGDLGGLTVNFTKQ